MCASHRIHVAGNRGFIAWAHEDAGGNQTALESRPHADIYSGITDEESTYVAAHVGLFWCIGTFRIGNGERVSIAASAKRAPSLFSLQKPQSRIITEKIHFIGQLTDLRQIAVSYVDVAGDLNPAEAEIARLYAQ